MRFSKLITVILSITLVALVYVHQQVELVKLSYAIECKEKALKVMLDRKDGLGYNIGNLEAPSRLEAALFAKRIEISFPKQAHVVRTASEQPAGKRDVLHVASAKNPGLLGIFDFLTSRAEAQTHVK